MIFYFAFKYVFKTDTPNYLTALMLGVSCWSFFSQSVIAAMESVLGHYSILNKVPIAPATFPLSEVIGTFINLTLGIPVVLLVAVLDNVHIGFHWLGAFFWIFLIAAKAYFLGLFLSISFVFLRDLRHLVTILMQAWFYLTPVVYHRSMLPKEFEFLIFVNPIWVDFANLKLIISGSWPFSSFLELFVSLAWLLTLFFLSVFMYAAKRKVLVERM
jgi:ABC-type polysaccharide/polyol phosphate export permease